MNLTALPELLLSWVKTQGASLLQVGKVEQVSPFQPGQDYQGTVLDQLPNGRYLVQIAEQQLDMNLPAGTRTGESLRLTFLDAGPRPTFQLDAAPVAPVQEVHLSGTAQQVGALLRLNAAMPAMQTGTATATGAAAQPAGTPAGAAAMRNVAVPQQSAGVLPAAPETARIVSAGTGFPTPVQPGIPARVIAMTNGVPSPGTTAAANPIVVSARPIAASVTMLQSPAIPAAGVAAPVASATAEILGETLDGLREALPAGATTTANAVAQLPVPSRQMLPIRLAQTVSESGLFYESHLSKWANGDWPRENLLREPQADFNRPGSPGTGLPEFAGMSEDAARMAGRQLLLLEGAPFIWQGQAWPGQWMQWQVEQWQGGNTDAEPATADTWVSEIRVTLPSLGGVNARVALSGRRLSLNLAVVDGAALERLRTALPELVQALRDAGLEPGRMALEPTHG